MIGSLGRLIASRRWIWAVAAAVLLAAAFLGTRASAQWLGLLVSAMGALVLLQHPSLGPLALVFAALVVPLEFGTGSEHRIGFIRKTVHAHEQTGWRVIDQRLHNPFIV